jgi:phage-Barnase-EndoU-ColicinE5/D-RelE like nuclease2
MWKPKSSPSRRIAPLAGGSSIPLVQICVVSTEVQTEDDRYEETKRAVLRTIGQPGPWKRLFLPAWDAIIERRGLDHVSRKTLFEEYAAVSKEKRADLVRHYLGLNRGKETKPLAAPDPFGRIHVDRETVKHLLDDFYRHRQAASHLRYLPLVPRTVGDPFEVWASAKAIYHRGTTLLFLRPYIVGTSVINHMVVVAEDTGWVVTAFAHSDDERDCQRDGYLRFARY